MILGRGTESPYAGWCGQINKIKFLKNKKKTQTFLQQELVKVCGQDCGGIQNRVSWGGSVKEPGRVPWHSVPLWEIGEGECLLDVRGPVWCMRCFSLSLQRRELKVWEVKWFAWGSLNSGLLAFQAVDGLGESWFLTHKLTSFSV